MIEAIAKMIFAFVMLDFLVAAGMVVTVIIRETVLWMIWRWRKKHGRDNDE